MTEYAVLLPGDETAWASADPDERAAVYARHAEFARLLEERGHKITGGAELAPSASARIVRRAGDGLRVTDGPYAESVEQLTGFYLVRSDDLDDLVEICGLLATGAEAVEVRATVAPDGGA